MDEMKRRVEEGMKKQSFAGLLGLKIEEAEEGRVVVSCARRPDLLQQTGLLHGGVITATCETAAAYAAMTVLPEGQSVIGVESKINLLRPVTADKLIVKAKILKRGRQLVVVESEAYNAGSDKIAAKMTFTGMPIQG